MSKNAKGSKLFLFPKCVYVGMYVVCSATECECGRISSCFRYLSIFDLSCCRGRGNLVLCLQCDWCAFLCLFCSDLEISTIQPTTSVSPTACPLSMQPISRWLCLQAANHLVPCQSCDPWFHPLVSCGGKTEYAIIPNHIPPICNMNICPLWPLLRQLC